MEVGHKGMERSASRSPEGLILEASITASTMLRHRAARRQPAQPLFLSPTGIKMGGGVLGVPPFPLPEAFNLSPSCLAASWRMLWLGLSQSPRGWVTYVLLFSKQLCTERMQLAECHHAGAGESCRIPMKPFRPGRNGTGDVVIVCSLWWE